MTQITVTRRILTDGSPVFDVRLGGIILAAVTEKDAFALADKIECAINAHTTDGAKTVTDY